MSTVLERHTERKLRMHRLAAEPAGPFGPIALEAMHEIDGAIRDIEQLESENAALREQVKGLREWLEKRRDEEVGCDPNFHFHSGLRTAYAATINQLDRLALGREGQ